MSHDLATMVRTPAIAGTPAVPGQDEQDRPLICRGPLSFASDPLEFWYDDMRVPLSPSEGALLALLMRRGRAPWPAVDEVLRDGGSSRAIRDVMVYRIRRKFEHAGGSDPIETVRGWGLKLRVERRSGGPASLVIGGRKPAFDAER